MTTPNPEMIPILRECCWLKTPVIVLSPDTGAVCHARFAAVSPESVRLELSEETNLLPKATRCCIAFSHGNSSCAVFATVLEHECVHPPGPSHLDLEISTNVFGTEARVAYRVPVGKWVVPSVRITMQDNRVLRPMPIDISFTGILLEFSPEEDPDFSISEEVDLELYLRGNTVCLRAEVRRRNGHRYGLFFPETVNKHGVQVPESMRNIVEELERARLKERIR